MSEIHCATPDEIMLDLQSALGVNTPTEVVQEAFTLLAWAVQERRRGRVVLSAQRNGTDAERLAMRSLERVSAQM